MLDPPFCKRTSTIIVKRYALWSRHREVYEMLALKTDNSDFYQYVYTFDNNFILNVYLKLRLCLFKNKGKRCDIDKNSKLWKSIGPYLKT